MNNLKYKDISIDDLRVLINKTDHIDGVVVGNELRIGVRDGYVVMPLTSRMKILFSERKPLFIGGDF